MSFETDMRYWETLHELIDSEPAYNAYRNAYGELAALGIVKGQPFAPDERMTEILTRAASPAGQMLVQSLADRRPDRVVWEGSQWEWAVLRPENGTFDADTHVDLQAREKWFFQAQIESPAMFSRAPGAGSLYWLYAHDSTGAYLDGARPTASECRSRCPRSCSGRSRPMTHRHAPRSSPTSARRAALPGRAHPAGARRRATETISTSAPSYPTTHKGAGSNHPGRGWFVYFRIYGPERSAFDGNWQLPDFDPIQ